MKVEILRTSDNGIQTEGVMYVIKDERIVFECNTLELPWKDNKTRESCVPSGTYEVVKHNSPKFGLCFWLQKVKNRSQILIHKGNYYTDILGCILVGDKFSDINKDGQIDVVNSGKTMEKLLKILPEKFNLEIIYRS